ncbi:hypothetical protein PGB90_008978 [Kerria lacca]
MINYCSINNRKDRRTELKRMTKKKLPRVNNRDNRRKAASTVPRINTNNNNTQIFKICYHF